MTASEAAAAPEPPAQTASSPEARDIALRRQMMGVLARATEEELVSGLAALGAIPQSEELRPPEIGLVMLRGRIGGDGAPFNFGEATVTRAAVRLATGEVGTSYLLGRRPQAARAAALVDALWQKPETRSAVEQHVLAPIRTRSDAAAKARAAETAATRVEFFTLVRGEN